MPRSLERLAAAAGAPAVGADVRVTDLVYDSRRATPGCLFFCVAGSRADGHDHAPAAVAGGAAALVVERPLDLPVPQVRVSSVRAAMGPIAAAFFDHPSRAMTLVGVTGTNGKTTSTYLLEAAFEAMGVPTGVIGTVGTRIGDRLGPGVRTTPESVDLQRLLAEMRDAGVRGCAMEVSSHGLAYGRVDGTVFSCAAFTNLTQDHLDFHPSMEDYYAAKARLFTPAFSERAVINVGDPWGARLASETPLPLTTVALDADADVRALEVSLDAGGSAVRARVNGREVRFRLALPARYNVVNALGVLGVARALSWPLDVVADGLGSLAGVPGRLERIEAGQDVTVLVDYAHTPDSLEGVLRAARELTPTFARLIVVFGCGGDRDRGKRPLMGRAAATLADRVVITSDNPRSEDPAAIIAEIEAGARAGAASVATESDRRAAIAMAISEAAAGDVVVIAGKGHETGQEFADRTIPFDDRVVARAVIEELRRD